MKHQALTPERLRTAFDQIAKLEPGWFDGGGDRFDPDALNRVCTALTDLYSKAGVAIPYAYPTPEGRVWVEWEVRGHDTMIGALIDQSTGVVAIEAHSHDPQVESKYAETNVFSEEGRGDLVKFLLDFNNLVVPRQA